MWRYVNVSLFVFAVLFLLSSRFQHAWKRIWTGSGREIKISSVFRYSMAKFQQNHKITQSFPHCHSSYLRGSFFKSKYLLFLIVFADINFHHSIEGFNCYDFERNEYFIYEGVVLLKYSIKSRFAVIQKFSKYKLLQVFQVHLKILKKFEMLSFKWMWSVWTTIKKSFFVLKSFPRILYI